MTMDRISRPPYMPMRGVTSTTKELIMPGHDIRKLEEQPRHIAAGTDELLKIIHKPGYMTPSEFALVAAATEPLASR
jgi:hypothetical protein